MKFGGADHSTRVGVVVGVCLVLLAGLAIFPFRHRDYELQFLLVLPVVYAGMLSGRTAALVTAVAAVLVFHPVTRNQNTFTFAEDIVAVVTFLGSAVVIGGAVGSRADRLSMAKQREDEQRRLQEMSAQLAENASRVAILEQVDQQRVALLRSVSHDLRTPLATIKAVATDLHDGGQYDDNTRQRLLKSVSDEAERLDRLVGNLLSMSRIEAGSLRIDRQVVDLSELLELSVLRLGPLFVDVKVNLRIDQGVPLVDGDPALLDEVISNLVENAARYAPPASTVSVELSCTDGPAVVLRVRDHGQGVAPEHIEHIFEPFWRGPGSRSSGLGLAIARAIVEAHGGSIQVIETLGGGATFEVRLRAREDAWL